MIMIPHDVEELRTAPRPASLQSFLAARTRPLVFRAGVCDWNGSAFLESADVKELRTRWRLHRQVNRSVSEQECDYIEATVGDFLEWNDSSGTAKLSEKNPFRSYDRREYWAYADYQHVKELDKNWGQVLEKFIDWRALGCDKSAWDSTVWLGTAGSHTPLHYDTYGTNLVAQLGGRKRWNLYCPEDTCKLYPTRIPFEESSVYSRVDARAPDLDRFPTVASSSPWQVTLEAGDVLFVPKHWWHFVEALDTSWSVNVWLDAPGDAEDRVRESLVRVLMTSLASELAAEVGPQWLNPTEDIWPLEETLQVADIAFQQLSKPATDKSQDDDDTEGGTNATSPSFSVRNLVGALTDPDILDEIMRKIRLDPS